jgi:hypothetical protein
MRALAVGTSVRSGPTALLGPGKSLDDYNSGQLGELVRVEQQLAGAIAATHNHPGLLHDRTVDVDGQITSLHDRPVGPVR